MDTKALYNLWIATHRFNYPQRELAYLASATSVDLSCQNHLVKIYQWGDRDALPILLVHGWNGRATQLGAFITPLLTQGYQVVGFDAPGHGQSSGDSSHILLFVAAISTLLADYPHFTAVIAHSFGVPASLRAAIELQCFDKIVTLGAPATMDELVAYFSAQKQLNVAAKMALIHYIEGKFGKTVWRDSSACDIVKQLKLPGFILHDKFDADIPYSHAQRIHQHWPNSKLMLTEKLGHRRILRSKEILQCVVNFITDKDKITRN